MTTIRKETKMIPVDGGVDEYHDSFDIADNRKKLAVNIHINGGKLTFRPGRRKWGPDFTTAFDGVHEYIDAENVTHLLVKSDDKVYEVDGTTKTPIDTGLAVEKVHFHTHRGRCWYNGASTQRKITETTAARVGIVPPTNAPTITHFSTGLTGAYGWAYTFVIEESGVKVWESNPSPILTHSLSNEDAVLKGDASADTRITHRYIYRSTASGNVLQYTGKIADNVANSSYTDTVTDALLGAVVEENHGVPVQGSISCGANERMFWIVEGRLRYSEEAHTEAYQEYQKTTNFVEIPGGGYGKGLKRLYNATNAREDLFVFQLNAIHCLPSGDPNQPIVTVSNHKGCVSHDSIVEYNGGMVFKSAQDTVEFYQGGKCIDISSRNIPVSIKKFLASDTCTATLIFDHYYAICDRNASDVLYKNVVWVCDLRTILEVKPNYADAVWYQWNLNAAYLLTRSTGDVIYFDDQENHIYSLSLNDKSDETLAGSVYTVIPVEFETKDFNFGTFARWHPHFIKIKGNQSNAMTITSKYGAEYRSTSSYTLAQPPTMTVFVMGKSKMGDKMTSLANMLTSGIPPKVAGIYISFSFVKNTTDLYFVISGIQFTYTIIKKV